MIFWIINIFSALLNFTYYVLLVDLLEFPGSLEDPGDDFVHLLLLFHISPNSDEEKVTRYDFETD